MANDTDYRNLLMCQKGLIPAKFRGRGITGIGDLKLEFQTAYITKPADVTQAIRDGVATLEKSYTTHALRVPVLPNVVTIDHLAQDITDLTSVPIGVDIDSKLSATYDFTKDKINVILADKMGNKGDFFISLFNILKKIPKTKVRVLDVARSLDISKMPVECYNDKFDAIIPALIQEIEKNNNEIKRVYVINGISRLKEVLTEKSTELYEKFFKSIKFIK